MSDEIKAVYGVDASSMKEVPNDVKKEWLVQGSVVVDMCGSLCPMPVIATKKAMEEHPGAVITTLVDNEVSRDNVTKFGKSRQCEVTVVTDDKTHYLTLVPAGAKNTTVLTETVATPSAAKDSAVIGKENPSVLDSHQNFGGKVLLITKDYLGEGNEALGRTLMKTFMFCLAESDVKPAKIYFINSGVKMVTQESPHLENLQNLVEAGVDTAACGICLDFYGLKEKVAVGSITNLYAITEAMLTESMITL